MTHGVDIALPWLCVLCLLVSGCHYHHLVWIRCQSHHIHTRIESKQAMQVVGILSSNIGKMVNVPAEGRVGRGVVTDTRGGARLGC